MEFLTHEYKISLILLRKWTGFKVMLYFSIDIASGIKLVP